MLKGPHGPWESLWCLSLLLLSPSLSPNTKHGNPRQPAATLGQDHHHLYQTTQHSMIKVVGAKSHDRPIVLFVPLGEFLQARG